MQNKINFITAQNNVIILFNLIPLEIINRKKIDLKFFYKK